MPTEQNSSCSGRSLIKAVYYLALRANYSCDFFLLYIGGLNMYVSVCMCESVFTLLYVGVGGDGYYQNDKLHLICTVLVLLFTKDNNSKHQ